MRWVGGAHAFHQFHPISDPPIEHLDDIVANAVVFHRRWGWWPMQGWLDAFETKGSSHATSKADPRSGSGNTSPTEFGRIQLDCAATNYLERMTYRV